MTSPCTVHPADTLTSTFDCLLSDAKFTLPWGLLGALPSIASVNQLRRLYYTCACEIKQHNQLVAWKIIALPQSKGQSPLLVDHEAPTANICLDINWLDHTLVRGGQVQALPYRDYYRYHPPSLHRLIATIMPLFLRL